MSKRNLSQQENPVFTEAQFDSLRANIDVKLRSSGIGIYCSARPEVYSGCMFKLLEICDKARKKQPLNFDTYVDEILAVVYKESDSDFTSLEDILKRDGVNLTIFRNKIRELLETCVGLI